MFLTGSHLHDVKSHKHLRNTNSILSNGLRILSLMGNSAMPIRPVFGTLLDIYFVFVNENSCSLVINDLD